GLHALADPAVERRNQRTGERRRRRQRSLGRGGGRRALRPERRGRLLLGRLIGRTRGLLRLRPRDRRRLRVARQDGVVGNVVGLFGVGRLDRHRRAGGRRLIDGLRLVGLLLRRLIGRLLLIGGLRRRARALVDPLRPHLPLHVLTGRRRGHRLLRRRRCVARLARGPARHVG